MSASQNAGKIMPQTIKNVEIFAVGTWNGMKFTVADLEEIAVNTATLMAKDEHHPPLKMGHDDNQTLLGQDDGDPALGWVENIRVDGDKLIADFVGVPDIVVSAIQNQLFRQVSVEMRHIDHFGWVLTAAALLGADLPAVTTLEDLQAFLSQAKPDAAPEQAGAHNFTMADPVMAGQQKPKKETPSKDLEMDKQKELEFTATIKRLEDEADARKGEIAKMAEEAEASEEQRATEIFSAAKKAELVQYDAMVKDGELTPANFAELSASFDAQKAMFSQAGKFMVPSDLAVKMREKMPKGDLAADGKSPDTSDQPDVELAASIERIMFEKDMPYDQAMRAAFKQNPELAMAYKRTPSHDVPDWR